MKKKLLTGFGTAAVVALTPALVFAQGITEANGLVSKVKTLIDQLIPLVIGLALLVFLWGVLQYALSKEDGGKEAAKGYMLWGLIALFVMVSVWGLVNVISDTILGDNIDKTVETPTIPRVPVSS